MYGKQKKQLRPKLDRRNALKNVDYDASKSTPSSPSSFEDQHNPHRTRSLDLYPLTDRTSFRIHGAAGEFDTICRSLGISPEDFAIPVAAWEARKPCSRSDRLRGTRFASTSDINLENANELSVDGESDRPTENASESDEENELDSEDEVSDSVRFKLRQSLNFSPENGIRVRVRVNEQEDDNLPMDVKCGIKGSRPPRLARPVEDEFTSAWDFIKGFGPANDEDEVSPVQSTSDDIIGDEQLGEIANNEEPNEDYVRNVSQVSDSDGVCEKPLEQGVRDAVESSRSPSNDSYSLISKKSSKSPSGEFYSVISTISAESQSDESDTLISKNGYSVSPNCSPSIKSWQKSVISTISAESQSDESDTLISKNGYSVSPNCSPSIKSWQKGDFLGSGSFGTVYEGFTDDGFFFAVKEVSLIDPGNQQSLYQLEQEISLLSQFRHRNIVRYHGTNKDESKLYIFLELVTKGSLASVYRKYRLRDSHVSDYTRQILSGLHYLHSRKVIHRDIKCANILVDVSGSVKLADFGLAKATQLNNIKSCKGTAFWMAPEVVNRKNNGYGIPADIWSLGCTVLEMLTGKVPYSHLEGMQALFRIGRGEPPPIPDTLSAEAQDFIKRCLRVNPNDRPTAAELLEHPFVTKQPSHFSSPAAS
ncbi:mitogen-activated protein kinase kinase kinase 3-like [Lycium barbarum]|uniref:mitogen-activated protein kinase kinase kinase 3-like n=1 Tax=Lycium barbarum TaxID=112863 RepID=UPI00293F284B|nr:mitogen-activated protein kinase kinase kinase 3-like [Lycium barbarum]